MLRHIIYTTLPLTLLAAILCFVPLLNLLGYEFSLFLGIATALVSFILGAVLGAPDASPMKTLLYSYKIAILSLLPPLALILLNALRVRNCDIQEGLAFFALLPCISAIYGTTLGSFTRRLAHAMPSPTLRTLTYPIVLLTPLAGHLYWLYAHPPIFVFDHLYGFYLGSLYDEALKPDQRLLLFRAATLGRIVLIAGLTWTWHIFSPRLLRIAISAVVLGLCLLIDLTAGPAVGYQIARQDIVEELSREERAPGLIIHMPKETSDAQAKALVLDHQFRLAQLQERFSIESLPEIHSFVYRDTTQKGRLMGGSNTMIAKPWLGEIHIHGLQTPHRVLAHELAHAVAAQFGSEWLGISARYQILPNMGFIEGLAMAFTPPMGASSLHVYAASLRKQGRAPDLSAILGAEGFYRYAAGRAYNVAGSFIRYLLDTYGSGPIKEAYPTADFRRAFGKPLSELVIEWEGFLDTIEVSLPEKRAASEKFRRPSIFERPCAHVVAELKRQARRAKPQEAVVIYRELCGFEGNTPSSQFALAKALKRAGDTNAFRTLATSLINEGGLNDTQLSQLQGILGNLEWSSGNLEAAQDAFQRAFDLRNVLSQQRLQWTKLHVLTYPKVTRAQLMDYLNQRLKEPLKVLTMLHEQSPEDSTVAYLLARLYFNQSKLSKAIETFESMSLHPFGPVEAERWRLLGAANWSLGRLDESRAHYLRFANDFAPNSGERERGLDWVERIDWAQSAGISPTDNSALTE